MVPCMQRYKKRTQKQRENNKLTHADESYGYNRLVKTIPSNDLDRENNGWGYHMLAILLQNYFKMELAYSKTPMKHIIILKKQENWVLRMQTMNFKNTKREYLVVTSTWVDPFPNLKWNVYRNSWFYS